MKRIHLFLVLFILLLTAGAVFAQDGPTPRATDAFWQGTYWDNSYRDGDPVLRRTDATLDFDWGAGSPAAEVPADNFSATWTRYIEIPAPGGLYRFTATSDDGIRVWVDGTIIIEQWHNHPATTYTGDVSLTPGHHLVRVDYYEYGGFAVAGVDWELVNDDGEGWQAEYYNNPWLSGEPAVRRTDAYINFDWSQGSPGYGILAESFSARWRNTFGLAGGAYRITVTSDDGIRVFVDGDLILSEWSDHPAQTYTADVTLAAGSHDFTVEYYENTGYAVARFSLQEAPAGGEAAWRGEYYSNRYLSGTPALVRTDRQLNFLWGAASPAPEIPADGFSVRWSRTLNLDAGTYRFHTKTDDGVRLWVDGRLLIDAWYDQPYLAHEATIQLEGTVPVQMDYYENGGAAASTLTWERIEGDAPPAGGNGSLVDDGHGAFVQGGNYDWHTAAGGYANGLTWTRNNDYGRPGYNWARWYPDLARGRYEVYVYIPERYSTTRNARYWIAHRDGFTLRVVDQSANADRWVSLGTYWFQGNNRDYLSLSHITFEPYLSSLVAFDAARWEPR